MPLRKFLRGEGIGLTFFPGFPSLETWTLHLGNGETSQHPPIIVAEKHEGAQNTRGQKEGHVAPAGQGPGETLCRRKVELL